VPEAIPFPLYEAIYGNMPEFGLAAATEHVPIAKRGDTAKARVQKAQTPSVPLKNDETG
jgi:hypothetical protein